MPQIRSALNASSWLLVLTLFSGLVLGCGPEEVRDRDTDQDEKEELFDQCIGDEDMEWLEAVEVRSEDFGPETGRETARRGARGCGLENLHHGDQAGDMAVGCMKQPPYNVKLSSECSECYSEIVLCTIDRCLVPCQTMGAESEECKACQDSEGCNDRFYLCSGLTPEDD